MKEAPTWGLILGALGQQRQARQAQHMDMGCRQSQEPWHNGIGVLWTSSERVAMSGLLRLKI